MPVNPLFQALRLRASQAPDDCVLEGQDGRYSAAELLQEVTRLAELLHRSGVRRLALHADNGCGWVLVDLAAQLAGIVLVPVPLFFTPEQVHWLLETAAVDGVCAGQPAVLEAAACELPATALAGDLQLARRPCTTVALLPRGTAKITFTSGSTGQPKGVCLSTAQCLQVAESLLVRTALARPRHLVLLPLATLLENIAGVYLPLLAGGTVVVPGGDAIGLSGSSGLDGERFIRAFDKQQPDSAILVPEFLQVLVGAAAAAQGWQPTPSLRFLAVGGARVAPGLVNRARALGLPVYEGYGLSECASVVALNAPGLDRPGSCGPVLPHLRVRSVDGELMIEGCAFLGYLGQPASWYPQRVASGDLGAVDAEGFVSVSGRRKNVLITSFGRNISPEWVESELLAGGALRQAVVLGDGLPACVALLLPADPGVTDAVLQGLVDAANRRLPDYARVGRWLRLAQPLGAEPGLLTSNGRPRRDAIAAHFAASLAALYSPQELIAS